MSEQLRICLVGATGLIGRAVIEAAVHRSDIRIIGVARREMPLPHGARMEMLLAEPKAWGDAIAAARAKVLVCALGTTMRKAGKDEARFRSVDQELVLAVAGAAQAAGIEHLIIVSSIGADSGAKSFYLRVKGETELALSRLRFRRLDVLRPGLLRGPRIDDPRLAERIGQVLAPVIDLFLRGKRRRYRSIRAADMARTIFVLAREKAAGHFVHEHDGLIRAIRRGETGR